MTLDRPLARIFFAGCTLVTILALGTPADATPSVATPADAAGSATSDPNPAAKPRSRDTAQPAEEDLRETITLLMLARMKNELSLDKAQYEQIVPKVEEHERLRAETFRRRRALGEKIRAALDRPDTKPADLSELVDAMLASDEAERRQEKEFVEDARKILTPRQQAQFIVFRLRFRQWLDGRMREARMLRGQGTRKHGEPAEAP